MDLLTFHKAINPSDEPIYTPLRNGKTVGSRLTPRSLKQMTEIAREDTLLELGLVIPANYMIIETKDKLVIDVIIDRQENLFVWNTPEGYRILGQSFYDKTTTNNTLACGVLANTIVSNRTKQTVVLPFKTKNSTSVFLTKYEKIYSGKSIGFFPEWLEPIHKQSRPDQSDAMAMIVKLKLDKVKKTLKQNNKITLNYSDKVTEQITARCTEVETGARNIDYILNANIFPRISRELLTKMSTGGMPSEILLDVDETEGFTIDFKD